MQAKVFLLTLKEVPVELVGLDGISKKYVIREMTGAVRDKFFAELGQRVEMVDGKVNVKVWEGFQGILVSMCLFDENGQVPLDIVQGFPANVLNELYNVASELSSLDMGMKNQKNG